MRKALVTILILCLFVPALAFETDQYSLPSTPLADIGDEVSDYVLENVRKAVDKVNARIASAKSDEERAKWRAEESVAREVYKLLGGGIPPFTNSDTWLQKHEFKAQPARFKTSWGESIYRTAPLNMLTISPTVKIYGAQFGTDKIAHIFQQGFTYYGKAEKERRKGTPEADALRKAIGFGRFTEKTIYGYFVSAVWSNADLAANYAGYKLYQNLTRAVTIDGRTLPPMLEFADGRWRFREGFDARRDILRPFVSDHLNEALNPPIVVNLFGLRTVVRGTVDKRACPQWRAAFPDLSKEYFQNLTRSLETWHGDDYGFKASDKRITIDRCFAFS